MKTKGVEVTIEELVVHDALAADREQIGAAVQRELIRLLTEGGIPAAVSKSTGTKGLSPEPLTAPPGASPEATGAGVARVVYGTLGK